MPPVIEFLDPGTTALTAISSKGRFAFACATAALLGLAFLVAS